MRSESLIFLISQPRAGSTLLQLMLAGHPDIATTSEPWISLHPVYALKDNGISAIYDNEIARLALKEFLDQSGVDLGFYKEKLARFLLSLYFQAAEFQSKKYFLDKTPRYYHIIPELMEIFPEAKFIILFRNPLAVLHSILKTWVKGDNSFLGYYRDDLMVAPQKLVDCLKKNSRRCFKVKYEELVERPETVLKQVCLFLGISYSASMLNYGNRRQPEWKLGDPVGVHKAVRPNKDSIDSWRNGLNDALKLHFAQSYLKELGPDLVKEMGYDYEELESFIIARVKGRKNNLIVWSEVMDETIGCEELKLIRKIDHLEKALDSVLNSLSWKVTAPLRAVGQIFLKSKSRNRGL